MFKIGDKVMRKPDWQGGAIWREGGPGVFTVTHVGGDLIQIDRKGLEYFGWLAEHFELVESAAEPVGSIQSFIPLIEQWGRDRGIFEHSTPLGQSRKTVEEVRELIEESAILHACDTINQGPYEKDDEYRKATLDKLADAIGDIFVTLVMVAGCAKLDINACVAQAYHEIKDRKGKMNDKGVWVKEEQV